MECKFRKTGGYQKQLSELIDTLWNVNEGAYILALSGHVELIDTLWNVNIPMGDI